VEGTTWWTSIAPALSVTESRIESTLGWQAVETESTTATANPMLGGRAQSAGCPVEVGYGPKRVME
jgi:hypothetical protein